MPWWGKSQDAKPEPAANETKVAPQPPVPDAPSNTLSKRVPQTVKKVVDEVDKDNSVFDDIVDG